MVRFTYTLLLLAGFSAISAAQTPPAANPQPNALELLQQISKKYAQARHYHIETVQESETRSDMSRSWTKSITTAILATDNRYRFASKAEFGELLKISDGKIETNYNAATKEYTQQPTPEHGPKSPEQSMDMEQSELSTAMAAPKTLSKSMSNMASAEYMPDEEVAAGGKTTPCYVVKAKPKYAGGSLEAHLEMTFWIDKEKLLVRKQWAHQVGPIFGGYTQIFIEDQTILYPVMELDTATMADTFFSFQAPPDAKLVSQLSDPFHPADRLTGTQAPAVTLQATNGKNVSLQDFHGKPVLLDFWATWCAPCVAALGPLKKLHDEAAPKGLTVLSIDEDEEAETATDFLAKHGVAWPNFHDGGEIRGSFRQEGGIPFYVLIDGSGKIVLCKAGPKDAELRAAIAKLGIEISVKDTSDAKSSGMPDNKPNDKPQD
jgi:outer membrane lipoprotein-sorting protein/peroxiredoxin